MFFICLNENVSFQNIELICLFYDCHFHLKKKTLDLGLKNRIMIAVSLNCLLEFCNLFIINFNFAIGNAVGLKIPLFQFLRDRRWFCRSTCFGNFTARSSIVNTALAIPLLKQPVLNKRKRMFLHSLLTSPLPSRIWLWHITWSNQQKIRKIDGLICDIKKTSIWGLKNIQKDKRRKPL